LQECGYEISQAPTAVEIEDAREKYQRKRDLEDINPELVLAHSRRKPDTESESNGSSKTTVKEEKTSTNGGLPFDSTSVKLESKITIESDDEEAEAQF
jgi:hypothetical protein